ncbi:hydrogenase maturation protease [Sphaerisporangium perillae]|uniref:hydrogenase maturation protease n=1 Tax=Sphaerisporangium perillae TaxID=2935860 RepID=UPI00200CF772|nr:hydrogenase maturation protease [Sphaerisporangium perillae]
MRVLVAGVGNVFLGDDGFGVAVARRLAATGVPEGVTVSDFGIRGVHLAYELTGGGHDLAILVDTVARGGPPGTLYVLRPSPQEAPGTFVDAHDMNPDAVLALARTLGGEIGPVLLVGCRPADVSPGMELSPPVAAAVGRAADLVLELIAEQAATGGIAEQAATEAVAEEAAIAGQERRHAQANDHAHGAGGDRRHGLPVDPGPEALHADQEDVTSPPAGRRRPKPTQTR